MLETTHYLSVSALVPTRGADDGASGGGRLPGRCADASPGDRRPRVRVDAARPGAGYPRRWRATAASGPAVARAARRAPRIRLGPDPRQPAWLCPFRTRTRARRSVDRAADPADDGERSAGRALRVPAVVGSQRGRQLASAGGRHARVAAAAVPARSPSRAGRDAVGGAPVSRHRPSPKGVGTPSLAACRCRSAGGGGTRVTRLPQPPVPRRLRPERRYRFGARALLTGGDAVDPHRLERRGHRPPVRLRRRQPLLPPLHGHTRRLAPRVPGGGHPVAFSAGPSRRAPPDPSRLGVAAAVRSEPAPAGARTGDLQG